MDDQLHPDASEAEETAAAVAVLQTGARRTVRVFAIVGFLTFALGAFMMCLHALRLDPSTAKMGVVELLGLYGFGGLFLGVGAWMTFVALFRAGDDVEALIFAVQRHPQTIRSATRLVTRPGSRLSTNVATEADAGNHQLQVILDNGRRIPVMIGAADVTTVLRAIRRRNPMADIRGL